VGNVRAGRFRDSRDNRREVFVQALMDAERVSERLGQSLENVQKSLSYAPIMSADWTFRLLVGLAISERTMLHFCISACLDQLVEEGDLRHSR